MQVLLLPESDSVVKKFVASEAVQRRVRFSTLSDVTDVEYVLDGYLVHAVVIAGQGYAAALALTKEICKRHANLSVIVAGKFDATEVSGLLFAGADDVVAPTVTPEYLCERIVCCCRRRQGRCQPIIEINDLVYNEQTSVATYGGQVLNVTDSVKSILYLLMMCYQKAAVTESVVKDYLYGFRDSIPASRVIGVFIHRLRRHLINAGAPTEILSCHCGKWHLCPPPTLQQLAA